MKASLVPTWSEETLDPLDLMSAVAANTEGLSRHSIRLPKLGHGFETYLRWSLRDIRTARESEESDDQQRYGVSALMNARRALSCLADQYLERDAFTLCADPPQGAANKAQLLIRRGVFDQLTADALARAVDRRNRVEHKYESLACGDVEDTVQLIRATVENTVAASDPYWAPARFGSFLGGVSTGKAGREYFFNGWSGPMFVLARRERPPWLGVVIPSSEAAATVRRVAIKDLTCDQMVDFLAALEANTATGGGGCDEATFQGELAHLGLIE